MRSGDSGTVIARKVEIIKERKVNVGGRRVVLCAMLALVSAWGFSDIDLRDLPASEKGGDPVSGREIYVNASIRCHGIDGKGALGIKLVPLPADLTSVVVQNRLDGTLFRRIHEGKPNTAMGAWKYSPSEEEVWDVLAHVRRLGIESGGQP